MKYVVMSSMSYEGPCDQYLYHDVGTDETRLGNNPVYYSFESARAAIACDERRYGSKYPRKLMPAINEARML